MSKKAEAAAAGLREGMTKAAKKTGGKKYMLKISYPVFHRMWKDLDHASDCTDEGCVQCAKIARSMEDGAKSYGHALEILGMVPEGSR